MKEKQYTIWVGGVEVIDYYVGLQHAKQIAKKYKDDGYTDVEIEEIQ